MFRLAILKPRVVGKNDTESLQLAFESEAAAVTQCTSSTTSQLLFIYIFR